MQPASVRAAVHVTSAHAPLPAASLAKFELPQDFGRPAEINFTCLMALALLSTARGRGEPGGAGGMAMMAPRNEYSHGSERFALER